MKLTDSVFKNKKSYSIKGIYCQLNGCLQPLKDFFFNLSNLQKYICIHCSGRYKRTSSNTQHNALLTFENRGFQRAGDEYVTINSVYDAGNDESDEPNKGH